MKYGFIVPCPVNPPWTGNGTICSCFGVVGVGPVPVKIAVVGKLVHCGTVQQGSILSVTRVHDAGMLLKTGHLKQ